VLGAQHWSAGMATSIAPSAKPSDSGDSRSCRTVPLCSNSSSTASQIDAMTQSLLCGCELARCLQKPITTHCFRSFPARGLQKKENGQHRTPGLVSTHSLVCGGHWSPTGALCRNCGRDARSVPHGIAEFTCVDGLPWRQLDTS